MTFESTGVRKKYDGYCVYRHVCIADDKVFYIGKGKGNRPWVAAKSSRSVKWVNFVNKYGPHRVELIATGLTENEAFNLECETIANAISEGVRLVNLTSGGEGFAGGHHSVNTKQTIRRYHLLKSEPLGRNPRRGVYFVEEDGNYSASITITFGASRKQFSLGRYARLDDAISIREKAESAYVVSGLDGLIEYINSFRMQYDTHGDRRRSVVVILKNKRLWFKGITIAAQQLGYKNSDLSNMLAGKAKSINTPLKKEKIYGIFYSKFDTPEDSLKNGELAVNVDDGADIDYRVEAGKARSKPHLVGFDDGSIKWYPSIKSAAEDLDVSESGLIGLRKLKIKSLTVDGLKIIYVKASGYSVMTDAQAAGELSINLSDLIGKNYHKINAPNQMPHVAVDSDGKNYWFKSAAVMCRELGFSNYGLLKKGQVKFLRAGKLRLVRIFESKYASAELASEAGEI